MSIRVVALSLIAFIYFSASAQDDTTRLPASFFFSLHSGVLIGKSGNGTSASVTLTPGIRLHRLSMVVGAGYDTFGEWQTIPVFAGIGYDIVARGDRACFVQLNTGYAKARNSTQDNSQLTYRNEGGYFYHPIVGYRVRQGKIDLYFTAGYKFQRLSYEQKYDWGTWGVGSRTYIKRDIERLSLQLGIGF